MGFALTREQEQQEILWKLYRQAEARKTPPAEAEGEVEEDDVLVPE